MNEFPLFNLTQLCFMNRYCDKGNEESINDTILNESFGPIHLDKSSSLSNCPPNQSRYEFSPEKTCKQNFKLELDNDTQEVKMRKSYGEKLLGPSEFCLLQYDGTDLFHRNARICMKTEAENEMKHS